MSVSKELGRSNLVAPQTTAVGLQIMDPVLLKPAGPTCIPRNCKPVTANGNGSSLAARYKANQLDAFDLLLNGKTYTYDLPAYTNGYQVKTAGSYNRAGNGVANVFSATNGLSVIAEAVVTTTLCASSNMTQPTSQ